MKIESLPLSSWLVYFYKETSSVKKTYLYKLYLWCPPNLGFEKLLFLMFVGRGFFFIFIF